MHDAAEVGAASDTGVNPLGQEKTPRRQDACAGSGNELSGHELHFSDPAEENIPGAHFAHVALLTAATLELDVPGGHSVQAEEPSDFPYEPVGHGTHDAALEPPISALA
jgi:hypothetical protein